MEVDLYVGEGVRDSCNDRTGGGYIQDAVQSVRYSLS